LFDYTLPEGQQHVLSIPHSPPDIEKWRRKADQIEGYYSKRLGTIIGPVESMIHIQLLKGLIKTNEGTTLKEFGDIPGQDTDYALQVLVEQVISEDERFIEREALPIEEEFPEGSRAFFLGEFNYGRPVHVIGHELGKVNGLIAAVKGKEPDFGKHPVHSLVCSCEKSSSQSSCPCKDYIIILRHDRQYSCQFRA
jgi:5'-3' exoribonuclease 1